MASPVDTSVKHIHSSMPGALALTGLSGSLIGLLDSFLVDGWGLQTATSVVVSGGVATVTFPSAFPAMVDMVVLVAGATPSDLNGEQKVTQVLTATNQIRFATALPDGAATGTITVKMAPAGWAKVFSGTNKAVYRSLDVQAHGGGYYLRVDNSGNNIVRVVGYETMVDVDTGTGPFPSAAQVPGGGYWITSATATSLARGYALAADSRTLYVSFQPYGPGTFGCVSRAFGDGLPRRASGDAFASFLNANTSSTVGTNSGALDGTGDQFTWAPRSYTGLGFSEAGKPYPYTGGANTQSGLDTSCGSFPNPVDGSLIISPKYWSAQGSFSPRFDFPGFYHVPQTGFGAMYDPFVLLPGGGALFGRNLLLIPAANGPNNQTSGGTLIDVTGPWR